MGPHNFRQKPRRWLSYSFFASCMGTTFARARFNHNHRDLPHEMNSYRLANVLPCCARGEMPASSNSSQA